MPVNRNKVIIGTAAILLLAALLFTITIVSIKRQGVLVQKCSENIKTCDKGFLFFVETSKCHDKGDAPDGICGKNMAILPVFDCQREGRCECDYERHNRTLIYHNESNRCYFAYTQGYCDPGMILTPSLNNSQVLFTCQVDPCAKEKESLDEEKRDLIVRYKNGCHPLYSEELCGRNLRFWKNEVKPSCNPPSGIKTGSIGDPPVPDCPPGSQRALNGHCHPPDVFEWEDE